jgi:hypothetical protein
MWAVVKIINGHDTEPNPYHTPSVLTTYFPSCALNIIFPRRTKWALFKILPRKNFSRIPHTKSQLCGKLKFPTVKYFTVNNFKHPRLTPKAGSMQHQLSSKHNPLRNSCRHDMTPYYTLKYFVLSRVCV